jgi:kynurenine formamidase
MFSFGNHSGTHIDVPLHICDKGQAVTDILKLENIYSPAICINVPKEPGSHISEADLEPFAEQISNVEALLIRTGFFKYRQTQP